MTRRDGDVRARRKRGTYWIVGATVGIVLAFVGGWWAAAHLESPEQQAAAAQAPSPAPVTAVVTKGTLARTISARGAITVRDTVTRTLPMFGDVTVVTARPVKAASTVHTGQAILELNGEPIFVLTGKFAFYRNLSARMSGPDVEQLQIALGVYPTGTFDESTTDAVYRMYSAAGATAPKVVPAASLIVIPRAMSLSNAPGLGAAITGDSTVTFSTGALVATVDVAAGVAGGVKPGLPVQLTLSTGTVPGKVERVGASNAESGTAQVVVTPLKPLPAGSTGDSVVAVIKLKQVAPPGLMVPSTAVIGSGALHAHVMKQQADGSLVRVEVDETGALDGLSSISVVGDALRAGDRVQVR